MRTGHTLLDAAVQPLFSSDNLGGGVCTPGFNFSAGPVGDLSRLLKRNVTLCVRVQHVWSEHQLRRSGLPALPFTVHAGMTMSLGASHGS